MFVQLNQIDILPPHKGLLEAVAILGQRRRVLGQSILSQKPPPQDTRGGSLSSPLRERWRIRAVCFACTHVRGGFPKTQIILNPVSTQHLKVVRSHKGLVRNESEAFAPRRGAEAFRLVSKVKRILAQFLALDIKVYFDNRI